MKTYTFVFIAFIILSSCSTSRNYSPAYKNADYYDGSSSGTISNYEGVSEPEFDRKILYTASISLAVKNPDSTNAQFEGIAKKYGGYLSSSNNMNTIIRVRSENFTQALNEISSLGKVQNKTIIGQDITEQYTDYQIRLDNAIKARDRYLELLAKAENVEAALHVEKELERLNETIELYKGKLNRLDHLSEFATITIYVKEKKKPGLVGYIGIGLYHSVKWLFVRN